VEAARVAYKLEHHEPFYIPKEVQGRFDESIAEAGQNANDEWNQLFEKYKEVHPQKAEQFEKALKSDLPEDLADSLPNYEVGQNKATRALSNEIINALADKLPNFWGGSADLSGSNKTTIDGADDFSKDNYSGRNIWFGVR